MTEQASNTVLIGAAWTMAGMAVAFFIGGASKMPKPATPKRRA
jgi:hypothetical protein